MSTTLASLSHEILDNIIRFLDDLPSLASLARVSKSVHGLVLPHLYRDVSLVNAMSSPGTPYLLPLTFLLLQSHHLASFVRTFTLRHSYATEYSDEPFDSDSKCKDWPQHPELDTVLRTAVEKQIGRNTRRVTRSQGSGVEDDIDEYFKVVRSGRNEAAVLSILLPNLFNLKSIDIPFTFEWTGRQEEHLRESHFVRRMFERATSERQSDEVQPSFRHVSTIMLAGTDDKYPDHPKFVALCAALPAVKVLYGWNQGNEEFSGDEPEGRTEFARLKPRSLSLEFIELRQSKLSCSNFSELLRAPKCLKTLIYEIGNTWAWTDVKFSQMQLALDYQSANLDRLCLSHSPFYPFGEQDEMQAVKLSKFSALKHLRVAPVFLYGGDRLQLELGDATRDKSAPEVTQEEIASTTTLLRENLPSGLETLDFIFCNDPSTLERLAVSLQDVLLHKEESFPNLQQVSIHGMNSAALEANIKKLTALSWHPKHVRLIIRVEAEVNYETENYKEVKWGWDQDIEWGECINNQRGPIDTIYDSRKNSE